jgi:hypothetical protein
MCFLSCIALQDMISTNVAGFIVVTLLVMQASFCDALVYVAEDYNM